MLENKREREKRKNNRGSMRLKIKAWQEEFCDVV